MVNEKASAKDEKEKENRESERERWVKERVSAKDE